MTQVYDAIVVGGGSVGLPSAYHLAKRGLKVLVIEKRSAVGQGENKAAIGGVRATHSDPAKITICLDSLREMTHWEEEHGMSVGWKPGGYAFPVYEDKHENTLKGILPIQKKYKLNIDWVDAKAMQEIIPGINPDGLKGGTYSPEDGQISSLLMPVAYQRAAEKLGAKVNVNESVVDYLRVGDSVVGVKTNIDTYHAKYIIVATGSDARKDGELLGIEIPVTPDSHEAGITAPVEHFLKPLVVDLRQGPEGKTVNFYFGQNHEGQIIFCYTPKELFIGDNKESLSEFLPILARRLISLIPRMRHLLVRRVWRGCYPMTPDGVPIIDNVAQIPGLTLCVGMCGQGFMMGPGTGMEIASLVCDGKTRLPEEAHASIRFDRDFYKAKTEALK